MYDLYFTFEEDRTTAVAVESDSYFGQTDGQPDRERDKHSSDFTSLQCHELHWTDNNNDDVDGGLRSHDAVVAGK